MDLRPFPARDDTGSGPGLADIPVVIMAGGRGTRMHEETRRIPKPMIRIGDRPVLWHIMKLYEHFGFRRFVLCLGYRSEVVKDYFLRYDEQCGDVRIDLSGRHAPVFLGERTAEDWEVTCAETGLLTGTAGRLNRVRRYLDTDTFLVTYGDGIGPVDVAALLDHHRRHGRVATVTGIHPRARYGELEVEGTTVLEFQEKPQRSTGIVSGGFFVFDRRVFDYTGDQDDTHLEHEPLPKMARDGELSVYSHDGFWLGMDTVEDLQVLSELWTTGAAPWKLWS